MHIMNRALCSWQSRPRLTLLIGLAVGASTATACSLPTATENAKNALTEHGTIDAEWEIRDDANKQTYTYVLLRNKSGTHETYELVATDNQQVVQRQQVGGINASGCFLTPAGLTSRWIEQQPPERFAEARESGQRASTACLEYQETPAWTFVPAKERKAAEPPPPPPDADAGTTDAPDQGAEAVESGIP